MKYFLNWKNFIIWLVEAISILLAVFNILPREIVLCSTGLLIFYLIFAPLEDAIWVTVASIPFFVALPISDSFDYMSNWRLLLVILFLIILFKAVKKYHCERAKQACQSCGKLSWIVSLFDMLTSCNNEIFFLTGVFLILGTLSLFVAGDLWIGVKKLIFLINIFLLFIIIRIFTKRRKDFVSKLINASKVAIGSVLVVGFIQLLFVFTVPLHIFWRFWAVRVIPVFYGQALSNLLSYSNTWFSYYAYQTPTLRVFSIFPDSHSFAIFCVLAVPFFLTNIFLSTNKKKTAFSYLFLIICLLGILFSGSRGVWVSAVGVLFVLLFMILLSYAPTLRKKDNFFITQFTGQKEWRKFFQLSIGCLIILIMLLPISSRILFLPHELQGGNRVVDDDSMFERAKSIIDFSEISVKSRLQIWQKSIDSIMKNPVLGVGIGNYPVVLNEDISLAKKGSSAHNLYLDIASEMGIFALLIFLAIFWYIFKDAWTVFSHSQNQYLKYWSGFFVVALIWILGYSLFDVVLFNDKVFLFFMVNLGIFYTQHYNAKE